MRKAFLLVLLLSLMILLGNPPSARSAQDLKLEPHDSPAPWEWSVTERITARTKEAAIRLRTAQTTASQGEAELNAPEPGRHYVIDGNREPELFLPSELMARVLMGLSRDAEYRSSFRRLYSQKIRSFGWSEEAFWKEIERLGTPYNEIMQQLEELNQAAETLEPLQRQENARARDRVGLMACSARRDVLQAARGRFGRDFDRFLYTVFAPNLSFTSNDPLADEAARLLFTEGGCR